jgi:hypothetical protein
MWITNLAEISGKVRERELMFNALKRQAVMMSMLGLASVSTCAMVYAQDTPESKSPSASSSPTDQTTKTDSSGYSGKSEASSKNEESSSDQVRQSNRGQENAKEEFNKTLFYAFLKEDPSAPNGPVYEYLKDKPFISDVIVPRNAMERKFRPMMQWRSWAERPQPIVPATLFIGLLSFVCSWLMPQKMKECAKECRSKFWKCFGTGALVAVIWTILTRSIFLTEIGWPLGVLLNALFQAAMLTGFSVAVFLLGNSLNAILRIHRLPLLDNKPNHQLIADLIVGSLAAALILQIPDFDDIPRIGSRLLALFAVLGMGSLYRIHKNSN